MARPLRIEYPGAYYHVISRGNAGQAIFKSNKDRDKFIGYLAQMVERFRIRLHCYCLMFNNYHLLIETPDANLSKPIQWLNASYAMYFNVKRERHGHLFQGRFKSILVVADEYLKQLSRYLHLNPIRANIVEQLIDYPWSSYNSFVGQTKAPKWLKTDWILELFGKERKAAQRKYQSFVETVDIEKIENPSSHIAGGLILGGHDFVDWVKVTFLKTKHDDREVTGLGALKPRESIDDVVQRVASYYGCHADQIRKKDKKKNVARDVAIYISRKTTGEATVSLGHYFGGINGHAITMRCTKVKEALKENGRLRQDIKRLLNND